MDDKESILRKCRALMAKTIENGCTEAEAEAAARILDKIMAEHDLSLSDLRVGSRNDINIEQQSTGQKGIWAINYVVDAIGYFTDTVAWQARDDQYGHVVYNFAGLEHDVLIAQYLYKIIERAIIFTAEDFRENPIYQNASKRERPKLKKDFEQGMAVRLSQRLREMKNDRAKAKTSTGADLVEVKDAIVRSHLDELGIKLKDGRASKSSVNPLAYASGIAAGDRVNLNQGVGRSSTQHINRS